MIAGAPAATRGSGLRGYVGPPLVAGLVLGAGSFASDLLHYPWSVAGNVAGTWLLVAFAVGSLSGTESTVRGAAAGWAALSLANVVYYALIQIAWVRPGDAGLLSAGLIWGLVAAVAGPLAGAAGAAWRSGRLAGRRSSWVRPCAVAIIAAGLVAEGALAQLGANEIVDRLVVSVELLLGLALPLILLRSGAEWFRAYGGLVVLSVAGAAVLATLAPLLRSWISRSG